MRDAGSLVAERYRLESLLGTGAQSEVWRAIDSATGDLVAVKLLRHAWSADVSFVRREVAALRISRMPGVVPLLDEGRDASGAFVVMAFVEGAHFPSATTPVRWDVLAPRALELLQTLGRIHSVGIVHRDLKPSNVLVGPNNQVTVLDFGIARPSLDRWDEQTAERAWVGTPGYLAPELLLGDRGTRSTDLYAVGVMLYEALCGVPPFAARTLVALTRARLTTQPRPPKEIASVPTEVSDCVCALLESAPEARPLSAGETLERLRGTTRSTLALPWLGSRTVIERLAGTLADGRSVHAAGLPGMGKTRLGAEVASELCRRGVETTRVTAVATPFGAFASWIGPDDHDASLEHLRARLAERLASIAERRGALVVDDAHLLDPYSSRLLSEQSGVPILYLWIADAAKEDREVIPTLSPKDLEALFAGPERILHLRSDAANALAALTRGSPRRVEHELESWRRRGLAREVDGALVVDRETLDVLDAGARASSFRTGVVLPETHRAYADLLLFAEMAGSHGTPSLLSKLTALPLWRVEGDIDTLARAGLVTRTAHGTVNVLQQLDALSYWSATRVAEARLTVANTLPQGADGRLFLLLANDRAAIDDVFDESLLMTDRLLAEGRLALASTVLEEAARALRMAEDGASGDASARRARLFSRWVEIACSSLTPRALDRVLYEIGRAPPSTEIDRLARLARGALDLTQDPLRALEDLEDLGPFGEVPLERVRSSLRMIAARSAPLEREHKTLQQIEAWATTSGDAVTRGRLLGWKGRLAYRTNEYARAADLHFESATLLESPHDRAAALLNSASSCVEAFEFQLAIDRAHAARELLEGRRNPLLELRAEWIEKYARYRREEALSPDLDLVEAAEKVGVPNAVAPLLLLEAAVRWRAGQLDEGKALAAKAATLWRTVRVLPEFVLLSTCLAIACGEEASDEHITRYVAEALKCETFGVGVQALGLLARSERQLPPYAIEGARRLRDEISAEMRSRRLDVLSADESVAAVTAAARGR